MRLDDRGTFLGPWGGKCLQTSVLACLCGAAQARARREFLRLCANHAGSGYRLRDPLVVRNLQAVVDVLQAERAFVWVLESTRVGDDVAHVCKFRLGDFLGEEVGVLLWFGGEKHVVRLTGETVFRYAGMVREEACFPCCGFPPWCRGVVGAPKKKGFRGGAAA